MAATMKIKKGDTVQVLAGKDRGKQGRVIEAQPREGRVIVENLNLVKRHRKPQPIRDQSRMGGSQMTPGGIFEKPSAIEISNVMFVCPTCKLATRLGIHFKEMMCETVRVRFCKRCNVEVVRRSVKFHAHDETNSAHVGDTVRIVETRPLSATKRWRLTEIVEVAK